MRPSGTSSLPLGRSFICLSLAALSSGACGPGAGPEARSPDLGPAPEPRILGPGVISTGNSADELFPTFTPDGDTLYFVRRGPEGRFTILRSHLRDGGWSHPDTVPFSGRYNDQEPYISPDGRRLLFTSDRPVAGDEPIQGRTAWSVERSSGDWGRPRRLEAPIRLDRPPAPSDPDSAPGRFWGQPRGPIVDAAGALWFWAERPEGHGATDIYRARPRPGGWATPINLGPPINSEHYETTHEVAGDGRLLIFTCDGCPGGHGLADLYLSVRRDGGWTEPRNLGPSVNSAEYDFAPRVGPGGRYLFFSSNRNVEDAGRGRQNIYYVEIAALELTPSESSS